VASKNVGYSIKSAWARAETAFNESGHAELQDPRGQAVTRSYTLWGPSLLAVSRMIARRVHSPVWATLNKRPAAVGKNYTQRRRARPQKASTW